MNSIQLLRFMRCASKKTSIFACLFLLANTASAWFTSTVNSIAKDLSRYTLDCSHWYAGGGVGVSNLHDDEAPGSSDSVTEIGPGWDVYAGYQFNSILGTELGYTQYHDSRETSDGTNVAKTEHYAVDLAATGRYPLFDRISFLGKLGLAYSYANKIFTTTGFAASSGAVSLYGGAGFLYSITPKVDLTAEWAVARGNNHTGSSELYSLGMRFAIV